MKINLSKNCRLKVFNIGAFREVIMVGETPLVLKSGDYHILDKNGGLIPEGTEVSYNYLNVKIKESYETGSGNLYDGSIGTH